MDEQSAFEQMAAALNGREITDGEGNIAETTASEESATQETNTEENTAQAQEAQLSDATSTQEGDEDDEIPAVDDSGKRYVPEKRLQKETRKRREAERLAEQKAREAEAYKQLIGQPLPDRQPTKSDESSSNPGLDRLELKMVFREYPQFNPNSEEYSQDLDGLAGNIRKANPGMSVMDAAEQAIETVKRLTSNQIRIAQEARTVKAQQSDQGITSRVLNRSTQSVDPESMTLEQKEEFLRASGNW